MSTTFDDTLPWCPDRHKGYRARWLKELLLRKFIDSNYLLRFEKFLSNRVLHEWVLLMIARRTDRHDIMSFTVLPGTDVHAPRGTVKTLTMPSFWGLRKIASSDEIEQGIQLYKAMILYQEMHVEINTASKMVDRLLHARLYFVHGYEREFLREASLCFMLIYRPTQTPTVKWSHAKDCARCKADIERQIAIECTLPFIRKRLNHSIISLICDMVECSQPKR